MTHLRRLFLLGGLLLFAAVGVSAWDNFSKMGGRSKAAEARSNLERLCRAQVVVIADAGVGTPYPDDLAQLEAGNRYAYFLAPGGTLQARAGSKSARIDLLATGVQVDLTFDSSSRRALSQADLPARFAGDLMLGPNGATWLIAAAGNLDDDPELDLWSVATAARAVPGQEPIPACRAFHEHDDIEPCRYCLFGR